MPIALDGNFKVKKSKKREREEGGEGKKGKEAKEEKSAMSESSPTSEPGKPEVDFTEIEAQLQAEFEDATKAQETTELSEKKKSEKKRRRSTHPNAPVEDDTGGPYDCPGTTNIDYDPCGCWLVRARV
jgi:hypothetical protein